MRERAEILRRLVHYEEPVGPLLNALHDFKWGWQGDPLIRITTQDMLNVLDRFLAGMLSAANLEAWAEILECREDVGFEIEHDKPLKEMLFRLANPSINHPLSKDVVLGMRAQMDSLIRK